ncbi:MAG: hypothetical protein QOH32_967 [Bradyrhizobium sp.]|nr:hypothetical protein [Bradyrhizobium sp.]
MGAPHASRYGGDRAARTIHRVSAVEGCGGAARRSNRHVTPDIRAASVSLRLATRSNCRVSPWISVTTAPSASHASASAEARSAVSTSDARTMTTRRGSRPSSRHPLIDSVPDSISAKSCRTHTSGRCAVIRRASPAMNPVAAALCRPSENTSCIAPRASPPCNAASASPWPSATRSGAMTSPVSMRSMLPRKSASMRVRAPVMRRSSKSVPNLGSVRTGGWLICS